MLLDFFQLREQPFSVSPHPSYLYSSRGRSEALESLVHAAASSCGVFALVGPAGVGKTTVLNEFLGNLPCSARAILLPHTNFSSSELGEYLAREMETAWSGKVEPSIQHGGNYILVVDNAEQLDASILETICGLADADSGQSVILTGQLKLLDKLRQNPSPLSFTTRFLDPLSGAETAAYVLHRLRIAGHPGIDLFERDALAVVAERSQGILRNINQICFRALLEGYASGCRTLSAETVEKAAQKVELGEALQPSAKPQGAGLDASLPHKLTLQRRIAPRKKVSSPVFLSQPMLRRAAVAALAASTLALPYLAAKRISDSKRPDVSARMIDSQMSSQTAAKVTSDSPAFTTSQPLQLASKPQSSPGHVAAVSLPESLMATNHGSNREAVSPSAASDTLEPAAVRNGTRLSLARELGLKINRIAIDAGHGGYDTGTIGPSGLMEKDLCLDVALRLGHMIKENIPGAEVIYTRTDDRHVPLEERTAIANDAQADLLISIHANSSDVRQIRGIETYYVSLAASPEAREIATRENAVGDSSLHNLPDLIKKITRNENLAESRQLASDIQNALSQRLQLVSRQETNRGVKRAPFIVLTGANMPAVLSEISFLSNPLDEKLLTENEQRQHVTEGLYRGIVAYLGTMPSHSALEQTSGRTASPGLLASKQSGGLR